MLVESHYQHSGVNRHNHNVRDIASERMRKNERKEEKGKFVNQLVVLLCALASVMKEEGFRERMEKKRATVGSCGGGNFLSLLLGYFFAAFFSSLSIAFSFFLSQSFEKIFMII